MDYQYNLVYTQVHLKITLTQNWQELEQKVSVQVTGGVKYYIQTNKKKLTTQGQAHDLTLLDTWTRAHRRIPSNPHNAGPTDQGP